MIEYDYDFSFKELETIKIKTKDHMYFKVFCEIMTDRRTFWDHVLSRGIEKREITRKTYIKLIDEKNKERPWYPAWIDYETGESLQEMHSYRIKNTAHYLEEIADNILIKQWDDFRKEEWKKTKEEIEKNPISEEKI